MVVDPFRSQAALEAEILTLRQRINVLRRTAPKKQTFSSIDRLIFVCLYRAGFRRYWRLEIASTRRATADWRNRARWLCRMDYRIEPARMLGLRYCFGRGKSAPAF
jgi:hypothetical protein